MFICLSYEYPSLSLPVRTSTLYGRATLKQQNAKPQVTSTRRTHLFTRVNVAQRAAKRASFVCRLVLKSTWSSSYWLCSYRNCTRIYVYAWERGREEGSLHANPWSSWKLNRRVGRPRRKPGFGLIIYRGARLACQLFFLRSPCSSSRLDVRRCTPRKRGPVNSVAAYEWLIDPRKPLARFPASHAPLTPLSWPKTVHFAARCFIQDSGTLPKWWFI